MCYNNIAVWDLLSFLVVLSECHMFVLIILPLQGIVGILMSQHALVQMPFPVIAHTSVAETGTIYGRLCTVCSICTVKFPPYHHHIFLSPHIIIGYNEINLLDNIRQSHNFTMSHCKSLQEYYKVDLLIPYYSMCILIKI